MATQIITRKLCDFCQADGLETPDAMSVQVSVNGETFEIDVCPEHGAPIQALSETLAEHGRKIPTRGTRKPRAPKDDAGDGNENACPECGKRYSYRASLVSHVRKTHGITLAELEGQPLDYPCAHCERKFASPQAIAVHTHRIHGVQAA